MTKMHAILRLLVLVTLIRCSEAFASAPALIIGLSAADRSGPEPLLTELNRTFASLRPGSRLLIYDAHERKIITRIEVPNEPRFTIRSSLIREFGQRLEPARRFIVERAGRQGPDQLNIPALLDEIGRNVQPTVTGGRMEVLLLGSALHIDDREQFSMAGGLVPEDGHLIAARARTPYGTADRRDTLKGMTLHLCHAERPGDWVSDLQRDRVERMWSLYGQALGAPLATFANDLATCFQRFRSGAARPVRMFALDPTQMSLTMSRIARQPDLIHRTIVVPPAGSATFGDPGGFMRQGTPLATTPPVSPRGNVRIGIRWTGCASCDLDLWVRPSASAGWLSYATPGSATDEGIYHGDHQRAPEEGVYEFASFSVPVDLTAAEAWVNFYAGTSIAPIEVAVRVWIDGATYERRYRMPALAGNRSAQPFTPGPAWARIDLLSLVGLATNQFRR